MLRKMSFLQLPKKDAIIAKVLFFLIGKPINIYGSLKEGKKSDEESCVIITVISVRKCIRIFYEDIFSRFAFTNN